jgi:hypothetical protein
MEHIPSVPKQEKIHMFMRVSSSEFILQRDLLEASLFVFLTPHTEEYYAKKNTKLYLSEERTSGFGINPDGELISVFSLHKAMGEVLVKKALEEGAQYLSCMGDKLLDIYSNLHLLKSFHPAFLRSCGARGASRV